MHGVRRVLLALAAAVASSALADHPTEEDRSPGIEEILVRGAVDRSGELSVDPSRMPPYATDASELLHRVPGGAVTWNGPLTGEIQLRGLTGTRVGVSVGGMQTLSGGPNRMDPPLHYAPRPLLERLDVRRGLAPVSDGPETVGGSVKARLKRSHFGSTDEWKFGADAEVTARSVDDSFAGGGIVHGANERLRWHVLGSFEDGGDFESNRGLISPTEYQRRVVGGGAGLHLGEHEVGLEYRRYDTDDAGTPALPMDVRFFDTDLWRVNYEGQAGPIGLRAHLAGSHVDHRMDNFALRAPPAPAGFRFSRASGEGIGYGLSGRIDALGGTLEVGADGHHATHDQRIGNPNNAAFFVRNFNDVEKGRYGGYLEWSGRPAEGIDVELGVRYTRVETHAGRVGALPPPTTALSERFNAAQRDRSDDLLDAVAKLGIALADGLRLELAGGRKTRAPNYIERYAWLPLEVTGGLADGNIYVGDIDLDHEVFYEVEGGFTLWGDWYYLAPRAFYKHAEDYIYGVRSTDPDVIAVATMLGLNGPFGVGAPLQYTNVDALLYGIDAEWALRGPWGVGLDGLVSWVRGRRRDAADELYRVAPLRVQTALSLTRERWRLAVEGVWVARQKEVAASLGERRTDDYGLVNFHASLTPTRWLQLDAGIENAFDAPRRDHLAGVNRVANSAVPAGARLPGRGRGLYGRVTLRW